MIMELIASYAVFPVISVRNIPRAAIPIPNNAAESSTTTVRIEESLLFLNSLNSVEGLIFSPLSVMGFLNCENAILRALTSKIAAIPRTI